MLHLLHKVFISHINLSIKNHDLTVLMFTFGSSGKLILSKSNSDQVSGAHVVKSSTSSTGAAGAAGTPAAALAPAAALVPGAALALRALPRRGGGVFGCFVRGLFCDIVRGDVSITFRRFIVIISSRRRENRARDRARPCAVS